MASELRKIQKEYKIYDVTTPGIKAQIKEMSMP